MIPPIVPTVIGAFLGVFESESSGVFSAGTSGSALSSDPAGCFSSASAGSVSLDSAGCFSSASAGASVSAGSASFLSSVAAGSSALDSAGFSSGSAFFSGSFFSSSAGLLEQQRLSDFDLESNFLYR